MALELLSADQAILSIDDNGSLTTARRFRRSFDCFLLLSYSAAYAQSFQATTLSTQPSIFSTERTLFWLFYQFRRWITVQYC